MRGCVAGLRPELLAREAFVHRTHRPGGTMEAELFDRRVRNAGALGAQAVRACQPAIP